MSDSAEAGHKEAKHLKWSWSENSLDWEHLRRSPVHSKALVCWRSRLSMLEPRKQSISKDRRQSNKSGVWKQRSRFYHLAQSLPSVLMLRLFECNEWNLNVWDSGVFYGAQVSWWFIFYCGAAHFLKQMHRVSTGFTTNTKELFFLLLLQNYR